MSIHGVKDSDYCEQYGVPESLCGTPKINDYMIDKIYRENIEAETRANLNAGMEPGEAMSSATKLAKEGMAMARKNLKNVIAQRGY
jgi:hypothetical protein